MPNLVVRIAGDITSLDKATKAAVGRIKGMAADLSSVGQSLTLALTAPLVGFAAKSLSSAANIEALKKALEVLEGSAGGAERRFKELLEVAKLPGLGIREAIQADLALRNYGLSAERAKAATMAFGNALAAAGRGKADLAETTRQFGQLSASGKVTAENLKPIIERVPQVADILQKAFGARTAEGIRDLGISSERLANTIITELGKAGKVSGGLKNDFENLSDVVEIAMADAGNAIAPFAKTLLNEFAVPAVEKIKELGQAFKELSPSAQTAAVGTAAFLAALGPGLYIAGGMARGIADLTSVLGRLPMALVATVGPWAALGVAIAAVGAAVWKTSADMERTEGELLKNKEAYIRWGQAIGLSAEEAARRFAAASKSASESSWKPTEPRAFSQSIEEMKSALGRGEAQAEKFASKLTITGAALDKANTAAATAVPKIDALAGAHHRLAEAARGSFAELQQASFERHAAEFLRLSAVVKQYGSDIMSMGEASIGAANAWASLIPVGKTLEQTLIGIAATFAGDALRDAAAGAREFKALADLDRAQNRQIGSARNKQTIEQVSAAVKAQSKAWAELGKHAQRHLHELSRDLGKIIFEGGKFGDVMASAFKRIGQSLVSAAIEKGLAAIGKKLLDIVAGSGAASKALGALFGVGASAGVSAATGAAGSAAGSAAARGGIGAGGAIAGTAGANAAAGGAAAGQVAARETTQGAQAAGQGAGSGATQAVTAGAAVVSAISGVIANFQFAHMNTALGRIEESTRYGQIHLRHILENANKFWPSMEHAHARLRQIVDTGIGVYNAVGDQGLRIAGGSTGGASIVINNPIFNGSNAQDMADELMGEVMRRMQAAHGV